MSTQTSMQVRDVTATLRGDDPHRPILAGTDGTAVVQASDNGEVAHPVARDEYRSWLCTCGMSEQERTGHAPQHADWCDLAEEAP